MALDRAVGEAAARPLLLGWLKDIGYEQHLYDGENSEKLAAARDKADIAPICSLLADRGFVVISPNYRLVTSSMTNAGVGSFPPLVALKSSLGSPTIEIVGRRPGEKLHEELFYAAEEVERTATALVAFKNKVYQWHPKVWPEMVTSLCMHGPIENGRDVKFAVQGALHADFDIVEIDEDGDLQFLFHC